MWCPFLVKPPTQMNGNALRNSISDASLLRLEPLICPAECKLFSRLGLRSTFYTDGEMLAAYPLKPRPSDDAVPPPIPKGTRCPLCRTSVKREGMKRTRCCHQVTGLGFSVVHFTV
jgi:hypothetical protein